MNRSDVMSLTAERPIVHLVDSSAIGGIERHIATLVSAQMADGCVSRIMLLKDHGDNPWLVQLRQAALPFELLQGGMLGVFRALRNAFPGILHTHGYKAGIIGRFAATVLGLPVVSTFHAGERCAFPVSFYQRLDELTGFLAGRIAVSEDIAQSLPFGAQVVPNFMSVQQKLTRFPASNVAAFVGRLSHEKGPDLFCRLAREHRHICQFRIYGDGPMRAELEAEFGQHMEFCGLQTDMDRVWPEIGLLVMPSRSEGLPMSALEALAIGIPILASSVGGLPTVVKPGETGWLAESENLQEFGTHLRSWGETTPQQRRVLSTNAHQLALQSFSSDQGLQSIFSAYRSAGWAG